VIFKDDLDRSCVDLQVDQRETIAVLAGVAPRLQKVLDGRFTNSSNLHDLREKIGLVHRWRRIMGYKRWSWVCAGPPLDVIWGSLLICVRVPWAAARTAVRRVQSLKK